MEKETFLTLVNNYTSISREEGFELISLQDDFPYSQVIHNLCSRAAQDNQLDSRERLLHLSAIYTTERSVLKEIMTSPAVTRSPVEEVAPTEVKGAAAEVTAPKIISKKEEVQISKKNELSLSGDALIDDLFLELDKLKVSQHKFEVSVKEFEQANFGQEEHPKKGRKTQEVSEPADPLMEEIKTKKKVKPDGPKQKEQIEIIENFIKTQPTISKNKLNSPPAEAADLAEKSLLYGDNIVSETLVEILLKQGKKDKAIEVLKKLIWKFPQKKAYFAAQIEDLKR